MATRNSVRTVIIAVVGVIAVIIACWHAIPDIGSDFKVYRAGAQVLLRGGSLYDDVAVGAKDLPFTYPPFAAVVFTPLTLVPPKIAVAIWSLLNVAALGGICWLTAARLPRLAGIRAATAWPTWQLATIAFILANLMEPITENFWVGQANLIVVLAVLFDSLHKSRWTGLLTGVATGFKITPGLFIVFMLVTRRWADAARAAAGFAITLAIGALFGPAQEWRFWTSTLFETNRVGAADRVSNAAIAGIMARLTSAPWGQIVWLSAAIVVVLAGLLLAAQWWGKDRLTATAIVGTITLLVSPISWIHHWVWMVPMLGVLIALAVRAIRENRTSMAWAMGIGALLVAVPSLAHARRFLYPMASPDSPLASLAAASYSIAAVAALVVLAVAARWYTGTDQPGSVEQQVQVS